MTDPIILRKSVKNHSITVRPTGEVVVTVALDATQAEIDSLLKRRSEWIKKQKAFFADYMPLDKQWVSGESIKYLGRQYRLRIIENHEETKVRLKGKYLEVHLSNKSDIKKKKHLVDTWYKDKALAYFQPMVVHYESIIGKPIESIRIRKMKTRWGSCNPSKSFINLNTDLIQAPKIAIEYVIFHELSHLIYPDHSKDFYHYLSVHMPDWQRRKKILEESRLQ
jgi:predicted metal-dependent hydrolase